MAVDYILDKAAKAGDFILDTLWEEGDYFGTGPADVGAELVSDDWGLGEWLGDGDASITLAPGGGNALAIAQQLVAAVLRNPVAMELLAQAGGFVFGRAPNYQGQGMNQDMLSVMFKQLPKKNRKPLSQRLAGLDSPIGLSKPEQTDFLMLLVYDGCRAFNVKNLDTLDCSNCAY